MLIDELVIVPVPLVLSTLRLIVFDVTPVTVPSTHLLGVTVSVILALLPKTYAPVNVVVNDFAPVVIVIEAEELGIEYPEPVAPVGPVAPAIVFTFIFGVGLCVGC